MCIRDRCKYLQERDFLQHNGALTPELLRLQGLVGLRRQRGRPIRWREEEEKALLRAFIQKTITTGPAHELVMVPWPAFAGVNTHSWSACVRRINFYRTIGNLTMPQARCYQLCVLTIDFSGDVPVYSAFFQWHRVHSGSGG